MDESRNDRLREQYRQLVNGSIIFDIAALRKLVLLDGLPTDANALNTLLFGLCSLRGLIWKVLLGVVWVDVDEYANLVRQGPSTADSRVRQDARRTFAKSDEFTTRVPTDKIIRLLNAYVVSRAAARASGDVGSVSAVKEAELRRKATGSAQDFFKSYVEIEGSYVDAGYVDEDSDAIGKLMKGIKKLF